jgi:tetratricopeptide (TPR) repeat protein
LPIYHAIGDKLGEANCIFSLGDVHVALSELPKARARYEKALPIYHAIGDKLGEANCIFSLGDVHVSLSELPEAQARYEEALPIYRAIGYKVDETNCIKALGNVHVALSELPEVRAQYKEATRQPRARLNLPVRRPGTKFVKGRKAHSPPTYQHRDLHKEELSMDNHNSRILWVSLLVLLTLGTLAFIYVLYALATIQNIPEVARLPLFSTLLLIFYGVLGRLWKIVSDNLSRHFSGWIDQEFLFSTSKVLRNYLDYLIATNRYLDTRLVSKTPIQYHFEIQGIYVPLSFDFYQPSDRSELIVDLFGILKKDAKGAGAKLAIIGRPGCGKTTLLKYIALTLAENKKHYFKKSRGIPDKLPIILTLIEHASEIQNNNPPLPNLVQKYYKNKGLTLPLSWIEKQLLHGDCVVLMDGLDQVAAIDLRQKIVDWIQIQMRTYSRSHFIVSSRKRGYLSNPILGVTVLTVRQFEFRQAEQFIRNWYLASEIQRSEPGDRSASIRAQEGATKLIGRLKENKDLSRLAQTPLLLTMITIVFSVRENLPGRRVELYKEMIDVSLEQRYRRVDQLGIPMSGSQKAKVLQLLAYDMMSRGITRIDQQELFNVIEAPLADINEHITKDWFVNVVRDEHGLLIEVEAGQYEFTHKTFQEYLTSVYAKDEGKLGNLISKLSGIAADEEWWEETIRLYAAQTDATPLIEKCLEQDPMPIPVLRLASYLLAEALEMKREIRVKLETTLRNAAESEDMERRALSAEAQLSTRTRFMARLSPERAIDDTLITNVEYQLFLDEMAQIGRFFYPDHWDHTQFLKDRAFSVAAGIRPSDALEFCQWITKFDVEPTKYQLPTKKEAGTISIKDSEYTYFVRSENDQMATLFDPIKSSPIILRDKVVELLDDDIDVLKRLKSAFERRHQKVSTTTELLGRIRDVPGGGGSRSRKKPIAPRPDFGPPFHTPGDNLGLLDDYLHYASLLEIELPQLIQVANASLLEERRYDYNYAWLPQNISYSISAFDMGESCRRSTSFFEMPEIQRALSSNVLQVQKWLAYALRQIRTREWFAVPPEHSIKAKWLHSFLRWYVRICIHCIVSESSNKAGAFRSSGIHPQILEECKNLLLDFMVLENRIQGTSRPVEGIRMVKIETRFGN